MLGTALLATLFSFVLPLARSSQLPLDPVAAYAPFSAGEPTLYDLIMIERRATIFGDYVRTVEDIAFILRDRGAAATVLLPTNKAVLSLTRKPCATVNCHTKLGRPAHA